MIIISNYLLWGFLNMEYNLSHSNNNTFLLMLKMCLNMFLASWTLGLVPLCIHVDSLLLVALLSVSSL